MLDLPPREDLLEIYQQPKTIAVVGISTNPEKAAHSVPAYLQEQGYKIVPINPRIGEILGETAHPSLEDVGVPVDIVDVFRPPALVPDIARAAVQIGASVLWMQPGTESDEAIQIAQDAGMTVIAGHCMRATHKLLGLGG